DLSQGHYGRDCDESFPWGGPFSQYPGKTVREPKPAGRSSGDHETNGSGAVRGGTQLGARGGHSDPAAAFSPGQASSGYEPATGNRVIRHSKICHPPTQAAERGGKEQCGSQLCATSSRDCDDAEGSPCGETGVAAGGQAGNQYAGAG